MPSTTGSGDTSAMTTEALCRRIEAFYRQAYEDYRDSVLHGTRVCGRAERLKVERQEREARDGVPGYRFDMEAGLRPLLWMALNLSFPIGARAGQPLELSPWQAWDTIVLFGWVREDDPSRRRFCDAFFEVARKNGKSVYAGALLDYLSFGEVKGVRSYIGATSLDQAEETFTRAAKALTASHPRRKVQVSDSKNNKMIRWGESMIQAIAAEPKDGKLAYAAVIDEYHQHKDNGLINSIHSGNVSDQQSLLIRITTAGINLNGVCHEEYEKCLRILSGELNVPAYFVSIYEIDEGDSVDDPTIWAKANPNWGISVDPKAFQSIYEYAKSSASDMVDFKTKNLNFWCHSTTRWANMDIWQARCQWPVEEESLNGRLCYGGLDLSSVSDFTAFTMDFPLDDGRHIQLSHFWVAGDRVVEISRQCRIPLMDWIQEGWVTATPGPVIDYAMVRDHLEWCHDTYQLKFIAADRWKIEELVRLMPPWFQEVAYEFSQGWKTMDPAIRDFERTYLEGKVSANGNKVVDWMMGCAESVQDPAGNVRIVKPNGKKVESRIDGVITSIMALANAKTNDQSAFSGSIEDMVTVW